MPACHELVGWEPWQSMNMHQLPIDNYIAYYLVDDKTKMVIITRIFYGGRDMTLKELLIQIYKLKWNF